jgi:hypothetical protein
VPRANALPFASDDDKGSVAGEDAPEAPQGRVSADVEDQVVALLAFGEVLARVVDDVIDPERPDHLRLLGAANACYVRAERPGDLHRKGSDAPDRGVQGLIW